MAITRCLRKRKWFADLGTDIRIYGHTYTHTHTRIFEHPGKEEKDRGDQAAFAFG